MVPAAAALTGKRPRAAQGETTAPTGKRQRQRHADAHRTPTKENKRKKTKKKKKQRKEKRAVVITECAAGVTTSPRVYSCVVCGSFRSTEPAEFSNHVRQCKKAAAARINSNVLPVVVSVSVWTRPSADAARSWDEGKVRDLLRELGATHSNTVHKRVKLLVATREAVERNTQRVRKARK